MELTEPREEDVARHGGVVGVERLSGECEERCTPTAASYSGEWIGIDARNSCLESGVRCGTTSDEPVILMKCCVGSLADFSYSWLQTKIISTKKFI